MSNNVEEQEQNNKCFSLGCTYFFTALYYIIKLCHIQILLPYYQTHTPAHFRHYEICEMGKREIERGREM